MRGMHAPPPRRGAWPALLAFTFVSAVTQLLWLNFAPLISLVVERYQVAEWSAKWLVEAFPLIYIFLSLHAGALIDRFGCRRIVGAGSVATAAFACLRIYDRSFAVLLGAQIGLAIAQPYVTNGVSKLVSDWFDEGRGAVATGVATMGLFIGMAVAMAATPALVAATSLQITMALCAAVATLAAVLFLLLVKEPPHVRDAQSATPRGFRNLMGSRDFVLVVLLAFLGLGIFNGLMTWLELLLKPQGVDAELAGLVGGALIVGGIVGAVVVPVLSDLLRKRKPFVIACLVIAMPLLVPLCSVGDPTTLLLLALAFGFFFLPAYALLLEMCSELAGHASAGYATGLLMLAGNSGGVVVIEAMHLGLESAGGARTALLMLLAAGAAALVPALWVAETFHHKAQRAGRAGSQRRG
jgi:predicted MFS family arabinose efflux permease